MKQVRVLVVDDLPDVQKTIRGLLVDEGCWVQTASTRKEALSFLENGSFHVAVLDVRLDESNVDNEDGLALMHDIKIRSPFTAIIILTGYAKVKTVQEALHPERDGLAPALYFLEKNELEELPQFVYLAYKHAVNHVDTIIQNGETEDVEFKSGIRWDYKEEKVNNQLQLTIAKSIVGMLNFRGGNLFIGVADDGTILGIKKDLTGLRKPDVDGFHLLFTELIRNYIGLGFAEYIHARFQTIDDDTICVVSIEPSRKPAYVLNSGTAEFWVRVGNSIRQLDVKDAMSYIQNHWDQ